MAAISMAIGRLCLASSARSREGAPNMQILKTEGNVYEDRICP